MNGFITTHATQRYRGVKSSAWWRVLLSTALIAGAGLLANRWGDSGILLLAGLCLGVPVLDRPNALRRTLRLRRRGWLPALVLSTLALSIPWALLGVLRLWLGAPGFQPPAMQSVHFMAQQLLFYLPLVVAEEFFFRGYLQETLLKELWGERRWGGFSVRCWIAALLFSLVHIIAQLQPALVVTAAGGLLFGRLTEYAQGQIGPAILLHLCINVAAASLFWLFSVNLFWYLN